MLFNAVFAAALTSALVQYAAAIDGNYIVLANRNSGGGVSLSPTPIVQIFQIFALVSPRLVISHPRLYTEAHRRGRPARPAAARHASQTRSATALRGTAPLLAVGQARATARTLVTRRSARNCHFHDAQICSTEPPDIPANTGHSPGRAQRVFWHPLE